MTEPSPAPAPPPPDAPPRPPDRFALLAGLALWAVALLVLTWPVWADPGSVVPGDPASDVWKHLWGDDWFRRELGSAFPVPLHTERLAFPDGGVLWNIDPLTGLGAAVLAPLLGLPLAHSLLQVGALLLGGVGAWLLSRDLLGDGWLALVPASAYALSANLQAAVLASGIGEAAHVGWLPLALFFLRRAVRDPAPLSKGWRWPVLAGLCLALSALGSWYYGVLAMLAAASLVGAHGMAVALEGRGSLATPAVRAAIAAGVGLLLVAPFAWAFRESITATDALHTLAVRGAGGMLPSDNSAVATLSDLISPGTPRVTDVRDRLFFSSHPGTLTFVLALMGAVLGGRRPRLLVLAALVIVVISLGPTVHWNADTPLFTNPVYGLFSALPGARSMRHLDRIMVLASLPLGLAAARGVQEVLPRAPLQAAAASVLAAALVIGDAVFVAGLGPTLPTAPVPTTTAWQGMTEDGAVIPLPATDGPGGLPFWDQVGHARPLPLNLEGHPSPTLADNAAFAVLNPHPSLGRALRTGRERAHEPALLAADHEALVALGFRYVVLRDRAGTTDDADVAAARKGIDRLALPLVAEDGEVAVYDLVVGSR